MSTSIPRTRTPSVTTAEDAKRHQMAVAAGKPTSSWYDAKRYAIARGHILRRTIDAYRGTYAMAAYDLKVYAIHTNIGRVLTHIKPEYPITPVVFDPTLPPVGYPAHTLQMTALYLRAAYARLPDYNVAYAAPFSTIFTKTVLRLVELDRAMGLRTPNLQPLPRHSDTTRLDFTPIPADVPMRTTRRQARTQWYKDNERLVDAYARGELEFTDYVLTPKVPPVDRE